eukprot:scaffold181760_cov29-Tisochrysis_lutea.AAC.2
MRPMCASNLAVDRRTQARSLGAPCRGVFAGSSPGLARQLPSPPGALLGDPPVASGAVAAAASTSAADVEAPSNPSSNVDTLASPGWLLGTRIATSLPLAPVGMAAEVEVPLLISATRQG